MGIVVCFSGADGSRGFGNSAAGDDETNLANVVLYLMTINNLKVIGDGKWCSGRGKRVFEERYMRAFAKVKVKVEEWVGLSFEVQDVNGLFFFLNWLENWQI